MLRICVPVHLVALKTSFRDLFVLAWVHGWRRRLRRPRCWEYLQLDPIICRRRLQACLSPNRLRALGILAFWMVNAAAREYVTCCPSHYSLLFISRNRTDGLLLPISTSPNSDVSCFSGESVNLSMSTFFSVSYLPFSGGCSRTSATVCIVCSSRCLTIAAYFTSSARILYEVNSHSSCANHNLGLFFQKV